MIRTAIYLGPVEEAEEHLRTGGETRKEESGRIHPVDPAAHAKLREYWQAQPRRPRPAHPGDNPVINLAHTLHQRRKAKAAQEEYNMQTLRTKLEPQEEAWLEILIRADNPDDELAKFRVSRGIHHKTFHAAVRRIRERLDRGEAPSALAASMEQLVVDAQAAEEKRPPRPVPAPLPETAAPPAVRPAATITAAAAPASLDPLLAWLTNLRAMRDELAAFGVTVEGSLNISIDL